MPARSIILHLHPLDNGHTKTTLFAHKVPIAGIAGDQQAALFGQMCIEPGIILTLSSLRSIINYTNHTCFTEEN